MKHWFKVASILILSLASMARAQDAFEAKVAAIKKAGEPIELSDFEVTGVADVDNAAIELRKAGESINQKTPAWTAYDYLTAIAAPIGESEAATFADLEKENGKAFAAVDLAMQRKNVDWGIKLTSPVMETLLPHLGKQRVLAKVLQARALLRNHENKDGAALDDVRRMIFVSRASDQQGFGLGHLVSVSVMEIASDTAESLAPVIKIGTAPGATPEQIKQLVAELMDDEPSHKGVRYAFQMERMSHVDMVRGVTSGTVTAERLAQVTGTGTKVQFIVSSEDTEAAGTGMLKYMGDAIRAAGETRDFPSFKAAHSQLPPVLGPQSPGMGRILAANVDRSILPHYRGATDRRLAAVALAMRAYAAAHDGKLPSKLEELVPEYLPKSPDDPMAVGQPLKYVAAKGIVYSVGDDGKDDGGSEAPTKGSGRGRWQSKDAVVKVSAVK